jgi:hypothetical protein
MNPMPRLQALSDRHQALEVQISQEGNRPRPDDLSLARLKREKLRLKEDMEKLRGLVVGRA